MAVFEAAFLGFTREGAGGLGWGEGGGEGGGGGIRWFGVGVDGGRGGGWSEMNELSIC